MGKSDKRRGQGKIDEQQKLAQGYLTGLQGQLAGQYGNYGNLMFGSAPSPTNNTFGWGTTTPHYSWTPGAGYFPGSTTGNNTPYGGQAVPRQPSPGTGGRVNPTPSPTGGTSPTGNYAQFGQAEFNQLFPGNSLSSDQLWAMKDQLKQQYGVEVLTNAEGKHGKIKLPNGQIVDVIGGMMSGKNRRQWLEGSGGGAGGGGYGGGGLIGQTLGDYGNLMSQYQNWANTGGLTETDKANLRGRAVSPIRAMYETAQRGIDRTRALQGGYSPGHTAAMTRLNRDFGQNASDATLNAEAAITDLMLRGKQFGLGGMSQTYGQTPGLANTFGNQMLQSANQQIAAGGLQNELARTLIGGQTSEGMMTGFPWAQFLGGLGNLAGGIGQLPFKSLGGLFGGGPSSTLGTPIGLDPVGGGYIYGPSGQDNYPIRNR